MPSTYKGTSGNDSWTVTNPGTFTLDGLDGIDTLYLGTSLRSAYTVTQSSDGAVHVDSVSGASGVLHATLYNMEKLVFANGRDTLDLTTLFNQTTSLTGTAQNDLLSVTSKSAKVDGMSGIDTVALSAAASDFNLQTSASGFELVRKDGSGTVSLTNVERLTFSDQKLALDLNANAGNGGNAGSVAKILGAVFGAGAVARPDFVGIGLSLLDSGNYTETSLLGYALDVALGPNASPQAVVDLLYYNLVGVKPDAQTEKSFVDLITNHTYTAASLGDMAANTDLNKANIHLTGLQQTGLAYS
jgi:hypothetical protein